MLESIQGEPDDGGDGVGNETENNSSSFGGSSYTASLNTFWEIDLWGKIRNMNASQKAKMLSDLHDLEYAKISLKAQFVKSYILSCLALNAAILP